VTLHRDGRLETGDRLRSQALTLAERQRRIPELTGLSSAGVLVVGAGSLGAPATFELVKAGVGDVAVIDEDVYDVNNAVRHILEPSLAGLFKADEVAARAQAMNPFITVKPWAFTIGGGATEELALRALVAAATVVVDTTGSNAVARILQRYCAAAETPLITAGLSAGSYGGEVFIGRPGGACVECLSLARRDGTVPEPPAAPATSQVTPVGCSHPAFSGAGFDATELAAVAARGRADLRGQRVPAGGVRLGNPELPRCATLAQRTSRAPPRLPAPPVTRCSSTSALGRSSSARPSPDACGRPAERCSAGRRTSTSSSPAYPGRGPGRCTAYATSSPRPASPPRRTRETSLARYRCQSPNTPVLGAQANRRRDVSRDR